MNPRKFETWVDVIDCTSLSLSDPDPKWKFRDHKRHIHRWKGNQLPTLRWEVDCPETEDYPETGHYECRRCGEQIKPQYLPPSPYRQYIPGLKHCAIDGVEVSKEEFERALKEVITAYENPTKSKEIG